MVSVAMFSQTEIIERVASRNAPKQAKITTLHQYKKNVHGPRPGTKICGTMEIVFCSFCGQVDETHSVLVGFDLIRYFVYKHG
jgi:hypothetical protein